MEGCSTQCSIRHSPIKSGNDERKLVDSVILGLDPGIQSVFRITSKDTLLSFRLVLNLSSEGLPTSGSDGHRTGCLGMNKYDMEEYYYEADTVREDLQVAPEG